MDFSNTPEPPYPSTQDDNPFATEASGFSRFDSDLALVRTARGLQLVYLGVILVVLHYIALVVGNSVLQDDPGSLRTFQLVILLGIAISAILVFIGRLLCLAVPSEAEAKGFIFVAVGCDIAGIVLEVVDQFAELPPVGTLITRLLSLGSALFFMLFLRRLAMFVREGHLVEMATSVIQIAIMILVLAALTGAFAGTIPFLAIVTGIALLVLCLTLVVRYLRLIRDLRLSIMSYLQEK